MAPPGALADPASPPWEVISPIRLAHAAPRQSWRAMIFWVEGISGLFSGRAARSGNAAPLRRAFRAGARGEEGVLRLEGPAEPPEKTEAPDPNRTKDGRIIAPIASLDAAFVRKSVPLRSFLTNTSKPSAIFRRA
jgi:hypothetical protein